MSLMRNLARIIRHPFQPDEAEATARYAETVTDQAEQASARTRIYIDRGGWFEVALYPRHHPIQEDPQ